MRFSIFSILFLLCAITASAQDIEKGTGTVYVFGVSQQLSDSVVFITDIQRIDSIDLAKKTKFLPYRSELSLQLKEFLEGKLQQTKQTACVFFATKQKKLEKVRNKLKKRHMKSKNTKFAPIVQQEFKFINPIDVFNSEGL